MSDDDRMHVDAQQLLLELRRSYTPTAEDAQRVLAATQRALAVEDLSPNVRSRVPVRDGVGLKLVLGAACIAVVSGAVGYAIGARGAHTVSTVPAVGVPLRTSDGERVPPMLQPTASPSASPSASAHAPVLVRGKRPAAVASGPAESQPASSAAESLETELRLLRSVELALREQRPQQALALLDELDRKVPAGKLGEERSAAFVIARCAIGLGTRAALLREFRDQHPDSVYLLRVEQGCGQ